MNPNVSLAAVNEHHFAGYCLKGKAKKITGSKLDIFLLKEWEDRINKRITHRLIKNIHGEKGHEKHMESILPKPEYLILMEVNKIVDLTPVHIYKVVK